MRQPTARPTACSPSPPPPASPSPRPPTRCAPFDLAVHIAAATCSWLLTLGNRALLVESGAVPTARHTPAGPLKTPGSRIAACMEMASVAMVGIRGGWTMDEQKSSDLWRDKKCPADQSRTVFKHPCFGSYAIGCPTWRSSKCSGSRGN